MGAATLEAVVGLMECGGKSGDPLFAGPGGKALSRGAVAKLVARHVATAAKLCPPSRARKWGRTAFATAAMRLLEAGVDVAVISL
jgi:hypothetical protein